MKNDKVIKAIAGRLVICIGILGLFLGTGCVLLELYFHFNISIAMMDHNKTYLDIMNHAAVLAALVIITIFILEPLVLYWRNKNENNRSQNQED